MADYENEITIPVKEYDKLIKDAAKLHALEAVGVNNWEGYGYAMELLADKDQSEE